MKFRKKPVVIEAVQFTGENYEDVSGFIIGPGHGFRVAERELFILTLEGTMTAAAGDWIIKGVKGEFYPIKDEIFRATYEATDEARLNLPL